MGGGSGGGGGEVEAGGGAHKFSRQITMTCRDPRSHRFLAPG